MVGRFWIGNFDIKASKLLLFEAFHNWKMASISGEILVLSQWETLL